MIRPVGDNVVVKPILNDRVTAGGIILPDLGSGATAKHQSSEYGHKLFPAIVLAVGPGKKVGRKFYDTEGIEPGQRVLIDYDAGDRVIEDGVDQTIGITGEKVGTELRIVRAEEIHAILD